MERNCKDEIMVQDERKGSTSMILINIKTMQSHTYSLLVDKCVPIPALKEQIASVTGVVTEQQRLLYLGRDLQNDQLLSAYHVEDGHTLHLVVREPIVPLPETSTSDIQQSRVVGHVYRMRTNLESLEEAIPHFRPFDGNWLASARLNIDTRIRSGDRGLSNSDLSNIMHRVLTSVSHREHLQVGNQRVIFSSFNEAAGRQASSSDIHEDAEQGDSTQSPP